MRTTLKSFEICFLISKKNGRDQPITATAKLFTAGLKLTPVIKSVRERAGLSCPPEGFTTNMFKQTNKSIQEFVKKEWLFVVFWRFSLQSRDSCEYKASDIEAIC